MAKAKSSRAPGAPALTRANAGIRRFEASTGLRGADVAPMFSEEALAETRRLIRQRSLLRFVSDSTIGYQAGWLHRHICEKLEKFSRDITEGRSPRLMIFVPPRHGKSFIASERFPCWHLGHNPTHDVMQTSYGSHLSEKFSYTALELMKSDYVASVFPDVVVTKDSVSHWRVAPLDPVTRLPGVRGGSYVHAGVGTGITGLGAHLLIVDDPVKDWVEANSKQIRDRTWDWFSSVAYSRVAPGGGILVIQTRWHEDDLSGRLLKRMEEGGEQWEVIKFPAIAEEDEPHRRTGEALHPERWPIEALNRIRALGERPFAALYQQRPAPIGGDVFQPDLIQIVRAGSLHPVHHRRVQTVRYWDNAGSRDSGCYTCGAKMSRLADGRFLIEHIERFQASALERERRKLRAAELDGIECEIWVEQEPGSSGKDVAEATIRMLAGYIARADRPTGDKVLRAGPLAAQILAGNVIMLEGPWNRDLLEELSVWPNGRYLDQGDALSGAFMKVSGGNYEMTGMSMM